MVFTRQFTVGLEERGVLFEDGAPTRRLEPGTHRFSSFRAIDVKTYALAAPLGDAPAALVTALGPDVSVVDVAPGERAVLFERGVPVRRLPAGRHVVWTHKAPTVERFAVDGLEAPALSPAVRALLAEDLITFDVGEEERVVLLRDNIAVRVLPAGRHSFWAVHNLSVVRYDSKQLVVELPPAHAALWQAELLVVTLEKTQRGVVLRRGKPARVLPPGRYTLWRHADVELRVLDVAGVATAPLDPELKAVFAAADYAEVTVPEGALGVRFVDGALDDTLPPGRHAAFCVSHHVSFVAIDLRERVVTIQGQDILTKDKVTLRLNASLTYRVVDVKRLVTAAQSADELLYLTVQLGLRQQVATHTLDEILSERTLLSDAVRTVAAARAADLGLQLIDLGVKDIILPGDMKTLLNKVIEAQKTAEANVILRREEIAAVRSMSQTAKLLEENPVLMRLKVLESYQGLADKVGTLHVVLGPDGAAKLDLKV